MPGPSIQQLLGLPSDITQPNAYQVFGLALGESDQAVISTAIERRIKTIKQAKSASEPDTWMQAVRAVQAAQKVLVDPEQKAALDAKYGILNEPAPTPTTPVAATDPLAALLPGTHAASTRGDTTPVPQPMGIPQSTGNPQTKDTSQATGNPPGSAPHPAATPMVAQPQPLRVTDQRRTRRRRGSGGLIVGSMVLTSLGLIVTGLAYMYFNGGSVQVVKNSNGFQVNTGSATAQPDGSRVAAPQPASAEPRGDGILNPPPPARQRPPQQAAAPENAPSTDNDDAPAMPPAMPMQDAPTTTTTTGMASTEQTPAPPTPPTSTPPGPEQMAAAEAAIAAARDAITAPDWAQMKSLAETAEKQAVSAEQKQTAQTLYQFADLATHYRSAVQKAMSELVAGNEFNLTESLTFLVQKSSAQQITLYRNKREYSYTLDELPLSVADALAPFGMNVSTPEGQAAQAVYQVISPKTTPGHRAQSIEILRSLPAVPGADPQKLADFIASLETP